MSLDATPTESGVLADVDAIDETVETTVKADLKELARVRGWARAVLPDLTAELLTDIVMVLDELVSNALRHAKPPVRVRLRRNRGKLRIEIDDGSPTAAAPTSPSSKGGRGMRIIEKTSVAWGQLRRPGGKTVWAELALSARRS
ncbi:ATP-binding protein [Amycolatopsis sp. NBC_01286]|uniref:ATP-binding protein n=1 Tax=Amycolatopsis sp. NBC_01286 TaxID=2903560 RepID=UPI002E0D858E|nr:ATP-binding protein [Amycolatopsis sp. NBC_01286]